MITCDYHHITIFVAVFDPYRNIMEQDQQNYKEYKLDPEQPSIQPRMVPVNWDEFEAGLDPSTGANAGAAVDEEQEEKEDEYQIPDLDAIYEALKQCHRMHFGSRGSEVSQDSGQFKQWST